MSNKYTDSPKLISNETFQNAINQAYQQGRADAIEELFSKKVFNNNTESLFDISLKECRNDFDDGWNRCYHDFMEIAEQLKEQKNGDIL